MGRDLWDIRRSDILLLHWWGDPGRQSIGTWVELGYAKACGKAIVVVDSTPSYQAVRHPFVYRNADAVFDDLDMGLDYIRYLLD